MLNAIPSDWIFGLIGGLMIGGAGALFLLFNGRIMGASGLLGGLFDGTGRSNMGERLALIAGLIAAPAIVALFGRAPATNITDNWLLILIGGLAVGFGTRMANGCTSGHGVCGISRLSRRGIVATIIYLAFGGIVMLITRHILGMV